MYVYTYVYARMCIHYMYTPTCAYVHIHIYMYMHICIYIFTYICIYIYYIDRYIAVAMQCAFHLECMQCSALET